MSLLAKLLALTKQTKSSQKISVS